MSIFSDKRLFTESETLVLVEDTPDIINQATLTAIMENDDIPVAITNSILHSLDTDVQQYYRYGRDHYTNGLPEGDIGYYSPDTDKVQAVLEKTVTIPAGGSLEILHIGLNRYDPNAFAREYLRNNTDWNYKTNAWTRNPDNVARGTYYFIEATVDTGGVTRLVSIGYEDDTVLGSVLKIRKDVFNPSLPQGSGIYYAVEYQVFDAQGKPTGDPLYWNYEENTNTYPELNIPDEDLINTYFLPIVPLRIDNVSLTDDAHRNTDLYKTSRQLLKKIDLSIEELDKGINSNPDIKDIDHAYLAIGVDVNTTFQPAIDYMWDFFVDLGSKSRYGKGVRDNWDKLIEVDQDGNRRPTLYEPPMNSVTIKDNTYDASIYYAYIHSELKDGNIGDVGLITKEVHGGAKSFNVMIRDPADPYGAEPYKIRVEPTENRMVFRKQVSATKYQEMTIAGLVYVNNIYKAEEHFTTLGETESKNFMIPLNMSIVNKYQKLKANELYYYSIRIVFNAYVWKKLKWYQTSFFRFVTLIISIALIIWSGGTSTLLNNLTAAAAAGITALATFVLKLIVKAIIVQYVFKFVAEEIGLEVAMIIAAIAVAYGLVGDKGLFNLPFASETLFVGTSLGVGVGKVVEEELYSLQTSMEEFSAEAEEKAEELKRLQQELSPPVQLDPLNLYTNVGMYVYESPTMFINRTLGTNTGPMTIDAVSNFVDNTLALPPY